MHAALPGDASSRLYFVCDGLLRYCFTGDAGKEWNKAFVGADTLTLSFSEDFLGYPSPYAIQALESTTLLWARYGNFRALFDRHASLDRLGRRLIEQLLRVKLSRERSFLQHNASARYLDFVEQYPELAERIPQYHLASYLGISEVALSRIRRKIGPQPHLINKC